MSRDRMDVSTNVLLMIFDQSYTGYANFYFIFIYKNYLLHIYCLLLGNSVLQSFYVHSEWGINIVNLIIGQQYIYEMF